MNTKPTIIGFNVTLFLVLIVVSNLSTAQNEESARQEPLEEIVVTAQRRGLINLGDLFRSEAEPDFVDPGAIQMNSVKLPNGNRYEEYTVGDKKRCFEFREPNPLDSFDLEIVYWRRC